MQTLDELRGVSDCCRLTSSEDYAKYFAHLNRVFAFLRTWYQKLATGGDVEAKIVAGYLDRLLYTVGVLRWKHLFNQSDHLVLDLNDSGLPHYLGVAELESDFDLKEERLVDLPSRRVYEEMALEELLVRGRDPVELLPQMAKRQFLESLHENSMLLPFSPGEIAVVGEARGKLGCLISWACYDRTLNVPFVYIMAFDYHGTHLELKNDYGEIFEVVRKYGNRGTTSLAVLGTSIDDEHPHVFPKIIKRVQIGPIICPRFCSGDNQSPIGKWLSEFGKVDDFVLKLDAEMIYSKGESKEPWSWLDLINGRKLVKQIFAISPSMEISTGRYSSQVQSVIILPHHLLQQIGHHDEFRESYKTYQHVTYTSEGGIYAVS